MACCGEGGVPLRSERPLAGSPDDLPMADGEWLLEALASSSKPGRERVQRSPPADGHELRGGQRSFALQMHKEIHEQAQKRAGSWWPFKTFPPCRNLRCRGSRPLWPCPGRSVCSNRVERSRSWPAGNQPHAGLWARYCSTCWARHFHLAVFRRQRSPLCPLAEAHSSHRVTQSGGNGDTLASSADGAAIDRALIVTPPFGLTSWHHQPVESSWSAGARTIHEYGCGMRVGWPATKTFPGHCLASTALPSVVCRAAQQPQFDDLRAWVWLRGLPADLGAGGRSRRLLRPSGFCDPRNVNFLAVANLPIAWRGLNSRR